MFKSYSYVISSGWWCTDESKLDKRAVFHGSDVIRRSEFHQHWYRSVVENTSPEKILVVDSASPVPPPLDGSDVRIEYIRLRGNAGHATDHEGLLCGWTRAVLLGIEYAAVNEFDYFVYVEQDALLYGKGVVEHCISKMNSPFMFGAGLGTPQLLQQSFFVIHRAGYKRFLSRFQSIQVPDSRISPEDKFFIASSALPLRLLVYYFQYLRGKKGRKKKFIHKAIIKFCKGFDELPIGYGRTRPINFSDEYFYFQHASDEEFREYLDRAGH